MIKYLTIFNDIYKKDIAGETARMVVLDNGRRETKNSDWRNWHDSWDDAHKFLVDKVTEEITRQEESVNRLKKSLEKIKELKPIE